MKTQASAGLKTKNRRGKALDAASMAEAPRLPSLRDELDGAVSPEQLQALIASVSARAFAHVRELLRTLGMAAELIAAGRGELAKGADAPAFRLRVVRGGDDGDAHLPDLSSVACRRGASRASVRGC